MPKRRCEWAEGSTVLMLAYHDEEWGTPSPDERHLFEMLTLEGAQAGLSWQTILNKREGYRRAFAGFDRAKVDATITNARTVLAIRTDVGPLPEYLWSFVADTPVLNAWPRLSEIPAETEQSRTMSKDLKKRGFRFVGPTICYAFMQAVGMVNDHTTDCFRYAELTG